MSGKIRHDQALVLSEVPMRTLDSYGFKNIGFIKIDAEGHEFEVLKGAERILKTDKPKLLVEIEERHRHGSVSRMMTYLKSLGYSAHLYRDGVLVPVGRFDIAAN